MHRREGGCLPVPLPPLEALFANVCRLYQKSSPFSLQQDKGVAFEEYILFCRLVEEIADVETALGMYLAAGASITAGA